LESERVLKHLHVKVSDVMKSLREKGYYEAPGAFFKFFGFMYVKIHRKPIAVENLKACLDNNEKYISVYDLFFNYSTPILLANNQFFEIPLKHESYIPDTTTKEFCGWIGNATLNHRSLKDKVVENGKKNAFFWRGSSEPTNRESRYIHTWGNHYDSTLRKY